MEYNVGDSEVDVSGADTTRHFYETGMNDEQITATCVGSVSISKGDTGTMVATFFDGSTVNESNWVCTGESLTGSQDSEITTSYTFRPNAAS